MSGQKKNNSAWRRVLKRHWKLFFVVFFLLGGLGNIGRNINTVIFCFFLAIVFLCWWQLKRREEIEAKELAEWTKTYEAEKKKKAAEKKKRADEERRLRLASVRDRIKLDEEKKKRAEEERRLRLASIRDRIKLDMEAPASPSRRADAEGAERSEAGTSDFSFQFEFDGIKLDDGENTSNRSVKKDSLQKTAINDGRAIARTTDYVVLDVETTGIDRKNDRMVEIAILAVSNGNIVEQYHTLVNPGIPISPGAYSTHGISDADVASAPKAESIAADIAERLRGKTVVGHNVTFDLAFIETAFRDAGITEKLFYIDTHSFSRKLFPTFPKYGLQDLLSLLHIEKEEAHRALGDVISTYRLFERCKDEWNRQAAETARQTRIQKEQETLERRTKYANSPLLDCVFVFTGNFTLPRDVIEATASTVGALVRTAVSGKTDYLVVGDTSDIPDRKKLVKAAEIIEKGGKLQKITEAEYVAMIEKARALCA